MTRPQIIRADTIDLQDHDTPSAKEHKHLVVATNINGSLAPHQAETLREVAHESAEENLRSPRVSWNGEEGSDHDFASEDSKPLSGTNGTMQQEDALAVAQNGGMSSNGSSDGDDMDGSGDEDMDDDMMDKISSSPSIEDGGYPPPSAWPARVDSLQPSPSRDPPSTLNFGEAGPASSSLAPPGPPTTMHLALQASKAPSFPSSSHHLLPGEYTGSSDEFDEDDERVDVGPIEAHRTYRESDVGSCGELAKNKNTVSANSLVQTQKVNNNCDILASDTDNDSAVDMEPEVGAFPADEPADHVMENSSPVTVMRPISPYDLWVSYNASEEDDDSDISFDDDNNDSRLVDSGWGGECLQNSEDIDFEFVYALHTFVATVEGQANATKGDTMVLLDDSNSYWWLVRVVKDSSIGYLPAEHIETPTERLARLNKHRNIDLSATMLGDQVEKTKNPLMSLRRRKAKTVAFTDPTYVDYSEIEYSTDEDEDIDSEAVEAQAAQQEVQQEKQAAAQGQAAEPEEDETAKVEPLKPRAQQKAVKNGQAQAEEKVDDGAAAAAAAAIATTKADAPRASEDGPDGKSESGARITKNGTVRNTDSFFKDDTVETKKITLTPNLLRDDGDSRVSSESNKDVRQRPSFDKLEKDALADKGKDDKKKKEKEKKEKDKKPSAIRNFFSRKDRKKNSVDEDDDSFGKRSMEAVSEITEKAGEEVQAAEPEPSPEKAVGMPQRNPSKLQKHQPRTEPSPTRKGSSAATSSPAGMDISTFLSAEKKPNNVSNVPPASLRVVDPETSNASPVKDEKSKLSKLLDRSNSDSRPPKVTKAKSRVELDDFDSIEEDEIAPAPTRAAPEPKKQPSEEKLARPTLPGAYPDSYASTQATPGSQSTEKAAMASRAEEHLSDSPTPVSPITAANPPPLMVDTSSQEDRSSPISSPSPELADDDRAHRNQDSVTTSTSATTTSTWNDANLRAFFDSGSDIRDLLAVVYDTTDVPPAGDDHPVAGTLFREQNAKLAEITTQLDNMLGDWLARKQRLRGTV